MRIPTQRIRRRAARPSQLKECLRRTRVLLAGIRMMADGRQRRESLRDQFFDAHADGMRGVAAHDSVAVLRAIVRENETIADQAQLVVEMRRVVASASGDPGVRLA